MGTGTITLLWYVACIAFVVFLVTTTTIVNVFSKRFGKQARFHVTEIPRDPEASPAESASPAPLGTTAPGDEDAPAG